MRTIPFILFILAASAGAALAHPGHGGQPGSHWLTAPDHLAVAVLALLALLAAGFGLRRAVRLLRDRADA